MSFIRKRVKNEADAEDIYQDTFYQLAVNSDTLDSIERLASWLMTVAANKITDWYRKRKPVSIEAPVGSASEDDDTLYLRLSNLLMEAGGPEDEFFRTMVWNELTDAMDELPLEQAEVFRLHELEGLSFKEIAEQTGVQLNTLLSRKRYAVMFLRNRLRELYEDLKTY